MTREISILVLLVLAVLAAGVLLGSCAMDAHAGGDRRLVPLATCTSQPYLRVGEVNGCEGWTESTDGSEAWGYGRRGADGVMRWVRITP